MGKPTICIGENKGADQLRSNREADQRLCFRYSDSTIPPLLNSKISSFYPASVAVQAALPGRKPHCWFSHEAAQLIAIDLTRISLTSCLWDTGKQYSARCDAAE